MKIHVQLYGAASKAGPLKKRDGTGSVFFKGARIEDLLVEMNLDAEAVIVLRNGKNGKLDHELKDGDTIAIMDLTLGG